MPEGNGAGGFPLNFYEMKKQIFLLPFLSLAFVFAGVNQVFGQANPPTGDGNPTGYENYPSAATVVADIECATVTQITCTANVDELHPQPGIEYTYDVTVPTDAKVQWFVLANDNNVMAAINDISANIDANVDDAGDGSGQYILSSVNYNTKGTTTSTSITWKAFDGATQQVLLVAYVEDAAGCTDNIELYRILPVPRFTLDVNAIASTGAEIGVAQSSTAEECVSPVENAIYAPSADPLTTHGDLTLDYGENWVFFTVTAANFTHSWEPSFLITYPDGVGSEVIEAAWAYPADAIANANWNTISDLTGATPAPAVLHSGTDTGTGAVGSDDGSGECIVVRVRIDHGVIPENAVDDQTIRMAVNGFMYDQTNNNYTNPLLEDLHYEDIASVDGENGNGLCDDPDGFNNDWVEYRLTPRPQIISNTGTPTQEFETKENNTDNLGNNTTP